MLQQFQKLISKAVAEVDTVVDVVVVVEVENWTDVVGVVETEDEGRAEVAVQVNFAGGGRILCHNIQLWLYRWKHTL